MNKFLCSMSCTWIVILDCLFYAFDSLSWDISLRDIANLVVALLYYPKGVFIQAFCDLSKGQPKKQVSMIRTYHNDTLRTNPPHRGEEPQNNNNQKAPGNIVNQLSLAHKDDCKTSIVYKAMHKKTRNKHRSAPWEQPLNHHLRTDTSLSHWLLKCILIVPNLRPKFYSC